MDAAARDSQQSVRGYHHGSLREALIDGAVELLGSQGARDFSLNEVARRAGVSSGAPYRHFESKDALLAAVAERGYVLLTAEATRPFPADADAGTRLLLLCIRYARFAVANSELFATMFQNRLSGRADNLGLRSFDPFIAAVRDAMDVGLLPSGRLDQVAVATWSALHGITVIYLNGGYTALGVDGGPEHIIATLFPVYFPKLTTDWTEQRLAHDA